MKHAEVPFFPAVRESSVLRSDLHDALDQVGTSGRLILGPQVLEFESRLAELTEQKYAVACASGTDAITLALLAAGITEKDEVIIPTNSYPSVFGLALSGATPTLVDAELATGSIDLANLESRLTRHTKAVLAVHLYGFPANLSALTEFCHRHNLLLIEDCAQALGSQYHDQPIGTFGDIATFSFYPTKNLGALGDGGAVVTSDFLMAERLRSLRMYGEKERYQSEEVGLNSRLDELQAAFLNKKLNYLTNWVDRRRELADIYRQVLAAIPQVKLLPELPDRINSYHLFPIRTPMRDQLASYLNRRNIQTGIHYPHSIHQTNAFKHLAKDHQFPISEQWNKETLSLPLHPYLTDEEIAYVAQQVVNFWQDND